MSTAATTRRRHAVDLVLHLVGREFKLRYRRSVLGWMWALFQPLSRLVIFSFVFTKLLPLDDVENYPVFLFVGILGYNWFSAGLSSATSSPVDRRDLLFRPGIPRPAVPIVSVLTDGLDYLAAVPVLVLFLLFSGGIPWTAVLLPVVLVVEVLLIVGLGMALCSANVWFRDVKQFVDVAVLLGFYITPVFYTRETFPQKWRWVIDINPMTHLLDAQRDVLVRGHVPDAGPFLLLTVVCAAVFVLGWTIYHRASPNFVDEL